MDSLHFPTYHVLFPVTIFLSAFLLFQLQPLIGRYILPWFGGGPAVWTSCLLFFQACLLAGYAYAHWLGSLRNVRLQAGVHIGLLLASLAFLPLHPNAAIWKPVSAADPSGRILLLLTVTVGGPYLLLSATAPLLQRWFVMSDSGQSRKVALAIVCSFKSRIVSRLAELSVRFRAVTAATHARFDLVRPVPGVRGPVRIRGVADAVRPARASWPRAANSIRRRAPPLRTVLFWLGLSACGSTLLVATTNQISQDIAVSPFLWVATLGIYLLTFVLAFDSDRFYWRTPFAIAAGLFAPMACALPIRVDRALAAVATRDLFGCAVRHLHALPGRTGAIPSFAPLSHNVLFDDRRGRRHGRGFRRPHRAANIHRIQ